MDANKPVKWGICGVGKISQDFCTILSSLSPEKHQVCTYYPPLLFSVQSLWLSQLVNRLFLGLCTYSHAPAVFVKWS